MERKRIMVTKSEMLLRIRRQYRDETGETEIDHRKVAEYAKKLGWKMPVPKDPIDILAKQLSDVAREEERVDKQTGESYRANIAYTVPMKNGQQLTLWVDTDEATRKQVVKAAKNYREQMVGEAVRVVVTLDHWSRMHPNEEPVTIPLDLQPDVDWRRNAPNENEKAS